MYIGDYCLPTSCYNPVYRSYIEGWTPPFDVHICGRPRHWDGRADWGHCSHWSWSHATSRESRTHHWCYRYQGWRRWSFPQIHPEVDCRRAQSPRILFLLSVNLGTTGIRNSDYCKIISHVRWENITSSVCQQWKYDDFALSPQYALIVLKKCSCRHHSGELSNMSLTCLSANNALNLENATIWRKDSMHGCKFQSDL